MSRQNSPPVNAGFFKKRGEKEKKQSQPIKEEIIADEEFDGSGSFNNVASGSFNEK